MKLLEICFIGISLSMDAFAVSISKGLLIKNINLAKTIIIGLYFAIFQALMPIIGYLLGSGFSSIIEKVNYWVAFISLVFIGLNMIKEAFSTTDSSEEDERIDFSTMLILSIATSIDALVVGVTFSFLNVNIIQSALLIGVITFTICILGVVIGHKVGNKLGNKANVIGGIVLILIGLKILLEHYF